MKAVVFSLRGAGWAAIGIFVGFVVSHFFRHASNRVDSLPVRVNWRKRHKELSLARKIERSKQDVG